MRPKERYLEEVLQLRRDHRDALFIFLNQDSFSFLHTSCVLSMSASNRARLGLHNAHGCTSVFLPLTLSICLFVLTALCYMKAHWVCYHWILLPHHQPLAFPFRLQHFQFAFIAMVAKPPPQIPSKRGLTRLIASSLVHPQCPPPPTATPFWPISWSSGVPAAQRHQAHSKK